MALGRIYIMKKYRERENTPSYIRYIYGEYAGIIVICLALIYATAILGQLLLAEVHLMPLPLSYIQPRQLRVVKIH